MSKNKKLLDKFLQKPNDFTYKELRKLFKGCGYDEFKTGKTSGSRVAFYNSDLKRVIRLHKSHSDDILKNISWI
jgi:hypothetical protein